jgi:hypothetical protein
MNMFANKTFTIALISLGLGIIFLTLENTFYQYVDNDGIFHESLFMPLGILSLAISVLFLLFFIIQKIRCSFHKK